MSTYHVLRFVREQHPWGAATAQWIPVEVLAEDSFQGITLFAFDAGAAITEEDPYGGVMVAEATSGMHLLPPKLAGDRQVKATDQQEIAGEVLALARAQIDSLGADVIQQKADRRIERYGTPPVCEART